MLKRILNIFGISTTPTNYQNILSNGGIILDVRTKGEFTGGHIKGSINIPVDILQNNLSKFKDKNQAIITCCASGMRSATAKNILKSKGYENVYNGGAWHRLQNKINN
ncbi:MAG: rhodanese-like domain-containing protein [Bacteroidia bacterium]|nr:rhodanese-like domain-containing protein [Bacteroidia bacterium]